MTVIDAVRIENNLYFLTPDIAGLFLYDCIVKKTFLLCRFEGYGLFDNSVCLHLIQMHNHIICAPGYGNTFYDFDLEESQLREITFDDGSYKTKEMVKSDGFSYSCVIDNYVCFVGYNSLEIVLIDPESAQGRVIFLDRYEEFEELKSGRLSIEGIIEDGVITIPLLDMPRMISFDVRNESLTVIDNKAESKMLGMCTQGGRKYLYSLSEMNIVELKDGNLIPLMIPEDYGLVPSLRNICRIILVDKNLYIIPFRGKKILKISEDGISIQTACDVDDVKGVRTFVATGVWDEHTLWAYSEDKDILVTYDVMENKRTDYCIPFADSIASLVKSEDLNGIMLKEKRGNLQLESFLELL